MDAAQTILRKIAFFLAAALALTAPFQASAQTLITGATSVTIGGCSQSQSVQLDSSNGSNLGFSVAIIYPAGNQFGDWVYASIPGSGSTTNSTPFSAGTTTTGVALTIGLQSNSGIGTSSPSATVALTPTTGPVVNITVFYSLNTSCGGNTGSTSNGFLSVAPGNVAISAASNGTASQTLTIQNLTVSGTTFSASVSPSGTWLSVSANSTTLSASGTATITVTGNAAQTSGAGNYNGVLTIQPAQGFGTTLTLNVVFTVTNGTSGGGGGGGSTGSTLTLNGASSNTYSASFTYVLPNAPGDQCVPLQDSASGADYYTAVVSTSNGGNWLLANNSLSGTTSGNLAPGAGACVDLRLSNAAGQLTSGAYQGSVAITSSSGATATITVNLYISAGVAPGVTVSQGSLIYVFPNVAVNSGLVQQQGFSLTSAPGYILGTSTLTNGGDGFSMSSPTASNNTESFTVTANSAGLAAGIYSTTVTTTSTLGSTTNTTTITIVLPVGQSTNGSGGGSTTTSVVAPASLAFQEQDGSSFWTGGKEAQAVTITGQQGTQWSATIVYASGASGWLVFDSPSSGSGTFGNSPATLLVDLFNVTNLTPSSTPYQATVDITTPSGTSSVAVSLLVTASNFPVLYAVPASATFSAVSGTTTASQTVSVVGSDNLGSTTSPPILLGTPTASWVSATTTGGNEMTISVNSSGQASGVYSATIPVSASAYTNAINYPVVMIVNGGNGGSTSGSGPLILSTTSMAFTGVTGQLSQSLNITANSSTQFTVTSSESSCNGNSWLQVTSGVYEASGTNTALTVTVNPAGLSNGTTCNGVITLVSSGSNGGTQTVAVSMTLATSSGSGNVTVSPTTMTFTYTQGQSTPPAQTATIVNATSGTASITFTVGTAETSGTSTTWLTTNVTSAATPYNNPGLSVSVVPGNLSPGNYQGTVTITPTGGSAQTIAVTLSVLGSVVVTATPTTLSLNYTVGGNSPTGTIQVSAGGAQAGFTASVITGGSWLQVSPTTGTTPNSGTFNLTASVIGSALGSLSPANSPYTGAISVAGTSPASGTTNINVTLTVTAPLPVISSVNNSASGAGGPSNVSVSPGELISLFAPSTGGNPIGPAQAVLLNSSTCPSPCTNLPTTMGGVTVSFQPGGYLAPLLYVGAGQINAIVPYQVAAITGAGALSVEVHFLGQTSNIFPLTVTATQPGIFTSLSTGTGQAAAIQYDNQGNFQGYNSITAAKTGWILVLYLTGEGVVAPAATTGSVTASSSTTPVPLFVPTVRIGNQPATLTFYGESPGIVSGVLQINVIVPAGAGTGNVPISVSLGSSSTQAGVTVSLQ